jgi:prepilin-type N-terminal cleavage/methylation domain-containing protein/prepilin-type processing-associated H-X9-DG protein
MPPMRTRRSAFTLAGFTLVELLVVIGIIAILIGTLLPVLSRARETANRLACLSNQRQIATAFFMYTQDNKGWFPCCAVFGNGLGYGAGVDYPGFPTGWNGWPEDWIVWRGRQPGDKLLGSIVKYLGNPSSGKIMTCPSDDPSWRKIANGVGYYPYSYAMNSYLSFGTVYHPQAPAPDNSAASASYNNLLFKSDYAWKITQVKRSADKIIVYEEDEHALRDGRGQMQSPAVGSAAANIIGMLSIRHDSKRKQPDDAPPVGGGKIEDQINCQRSGNVSFVDGHGEYVNRLFAHDRAHYDPKFP